MPAGKKPTPAAVSKEVVIDVGAVQKDFQTSTELALANAQHESAVRAMAERVGYQLDVVDPDLIQRDIAANMRRSVEACLEMGRGLVVLKTACGHGSFMARMEVLGIEPRVAQRFMQSAMKFSNTAAPSLLKAAANQSKLFELLVLDDEQIEEFELTGESAGLSLDDIARMGQKELRAALREAKAEKEAADRLVETKNKQIDKLQLLKTAPKNEQLAEALEGVAKRANEVLGKVRGDLRLGFEALAAFEKGGENSHRGVMKGYLDDLQRELDILRGDFFLLGDAS